MSGFGSVFTVVLCNMTLDHIYIRLRETHPELGRPELRLPLVVLSRTSPPHLRGPLRLDRRGTAALPYMLLALVFLGMTLMLAFLPLMAYVVDAFGMYSASAMTAVIVLRCLMETFLPLTTGPLVETIRIRLGLHHPRGGRVVDVLPIPALVMKMGAEMAPAVKVHAGRVKKIEAPKGRKAESAV